MRYGKIILSIILVISLLSPILVTSCGDGTGPALSDIRALYIYHNRAQISWLTDTNATSQVDYGTDDTYGTTTDLSETVKTIHHVWLENLEPKTTYHYRVRSKARGKETVSEDMTFTTTVAS